MSTPTDYGWMGLLPREVAEGSQCGRPVLPRERNGTGNLNCMILTADSLQVRKDGGSREFHSFLLCLASHSCPCSHATPGLDRIPLELGRTPPAAPTVTADA